MASAKIHQEPIASRLPRLLAGIEMCIPIVGCLLVVSILFTNSLSASAQQTFRDPAIPPGQTLGGQLIGTKSMGKFGISPHQVSNQIINLGVRQIGGRARFQLPNSSGSQESPSTANQDAGSRPAPTDPLFKRMQIQQVQLESISGVEVGRENATTPTAPTRQGYDQRESNLSENGREIIRQRYPDGKVQIEREVVQNEDGDYVNHGFWRVKDRDGRPIADGMYQNGRMHGPWQRLHTQKSSGLFSTAPFNMFQGPFISTAMFDSGKLDGMWTLTDDYEQKIFEIPYKSGVRDGKATWWYPSITRMREVTFKEGVLDGELLEWNQEAKLIRNELFREGRKIVRNVTFYRPKQMQSENYYLDGKLVLAGEDNWWEAKPAAIDMVGERVQHGPANLWFDNGLPKMRGQYVEGNRVGRFIWWHSNGTKQLEGGYEKGIKNGRWIWRHKNGMKAIEGNYENDVAIGVWKWWDEDGNVKAEEDMDETQEAKKEALNSVLDATSSEEADGSNEGKPEDLPEGDPQTQTGAAKDKSTDPYADFESIAPYIQKNGEQGDEKPGDSKPTPTDSNSADPTAKDSSNGDSEIGDFNTLLEGSSNENDDS